MKFSNILFVAGLATASPVVQPQARDSTVVGTVSDTVNNLVAVGNQDLQQVANVIETIKDSTEVAIEAQIKAIVKEDIAAVTAALEQAASAIVAATADEIAKLKAGLDALTQAELNVLAEALTATIKLIVVIQATVELCATDLTPAAQALVASELHSLENAVKPFTDPLLAFVDVAKTVSAKAGLQVAVLIQASQTFTNVAQDFFKTLGINLLPVPQ